MTVAVAGRFWANGLVDAPDTSVARSVPSGACLPGVRVAPDKVHGAMCMSLLRCRVFVRCSSTISTGGSARFDGS
ncbi:hypothetical protein D3C85_1682590 [compost metagenome]